MIRGVQILLALFFIAGAAVAAPVAGLVWCYFKLYNFFSNGNMY